MRRVKGFLLILSLALACGSLAADDVSGSSKILCAPVLVIGCTPDGDCLSGPPWDFNIPRFIEFDLDRKELRTTKASGENRSTPIKNIERANWLLVVQGVEQGRAFSFLIVEETGMLTASVARDDRGLVGFGVCTPKS